MNINKITLNCPITKYLSKYGILKYFSIIIDLGNSTYSKDNYLNFFNKLNNFNSEYTSLTIYFNDFNDIAILNNIKIDFNKIENLSFYMKMFGKIIEPINNMENLFAFTNLKHLYLERLIFKDPCSFNFFNLEELSLFCISNIIIKENSCLNLKKLDMTSCFKIESENNKYIKLPKLQILKYNNIDNPNIYKLIDFENLNKLKEFYGDDHDFILLKNSSSCC